MGNGTEEKSFKVTMNLTTATILLIIFGIVCIIISNSLLNVEAISKNHIITTILNIANTIGSTLFSAGIVSILVEISTIKRLVSDALNNVLQGNIPLDSYSNKILKKINRQIAAKRGAVSIEKLEDSIYLVEPKLIDLLDDLYYNYYNMTYEITPDNKKNVFRKYVTLEYEVINEYNKSNKVSHSIHFYNLDKNVTDEQKKASFKINSFIINNTDLSDEVENYKKIVPIKDKHSEFQYAISFERELQHCKKHKIHLEFEYEVPMVDISQIFRLTHPSKSMSHEIYINNDNGTKWSINGYAFVSFYNRENNNNGFHVKKKHDTHLQISFNNWCIHGAGYVAYLSKKE